MRNLIPCDNCGVLFPKSAAHAARAKHNYCAKTCWQARDCHDARTIFSIVDTQEKAYWLGMICADGWLCDRDKSVSLELQQGDRHHVEKFALWCGASFTSRGRAVLYSKTAFNDLVFKGVTPRKSLMLGAEVFQHVPADLMNHFIRGWFDGDGSIYPRRNRWGISFVGTKESMNAIGRIITKHTEVKCTTYQHKTIFSTVINVDVDVVGLWLYDGSIVHLERKFEKFQECCRCCASDVFKMNNKYKGRWGK